MTTLRNWLVNIIGSLAFVIIPTVTQAGDCILPNLETRQEGTIVYDSTNKTISFCNGTEWVAARGTQGPPGTAGPAGNIPSGAVMAFDLASCPSGWTAYAAGVGRTIVGVGTYAANADDDGSNASFNYTLGLTGGRRDHVLSVAEMPSHNHTYTPPTAIPRGTGSTGAAVGGTAGTSNTGGDGAHENRPPYVALLYCKKD